MYDRERDMDENGVMDRGESGETLPVHGACRWTARLMVRGSGGRGEVNERNE